MSQTRWTFQTLQVLTYGPWSIQSHPLKHYCAFFQPYSKNCIKGPQSWQCLNLVTALSRPKSALRPTAVGAKGSEEPLSLSASFRQKSPNSGVPGVMVAPSPGSGHWAGNKQLQTGGSLIKNRNNEKDKKKFPTLCNKPRPRFKKRSYKWPTAASLRGPVSQN